MKQYEIFELSFSGEEPKDSFVKIDLKAEFRCEGKKTCVDGFYAGNGCYKVRFYPQRSGNYYWKVTGIFNQEGMETCHENVIGHGMVKVEGYHFKYEDGTKYIPFGTTVYALIHQQESLIDTTMETLKKSPFNKLRFCVFPKDYDYNKNEPEYYAFEKTEGKWDVHKPCFLFWDKLEERILELASMGIEGDLILFHPYDRWGFSKFSQEEAEVYLDYLLRRLSAFPNLWWSMANEFDLMFDFPKSWWPEFSDYIAEHDAYGHCLSNHNCYGYWDFTNKNTTHCSIQDTCVSDVAELQEKYGKPVIFDECCYEGNISLPWGDISAFQMSDYFWTAYVCGGYCTHGETYVNSDEIVWWSRGGKLVGESVERIKYLKGIMDEIPGYLTFQKGEYGKISFEKLEKLRGKDISKEPLFNQLLLTMEPHHLRNMMERHKEIQGQCQEEVFIRYYGRKCDGKGILTLPDRGHYSVELIDTWNMTRKEVLDDVNGTITVDMPGREGMALLAKLRSA